MPIATWLIGSRPNMPETQLRVTANAVTETVTVPAGSYYLWDDDAALSLLDVVATAIATHSEIASCSGNLLENRHCALGSATSFAISSWNFNGAGNFLRDALGFTGTLAAGIVHVSDNISPYLWSPGKRESSGSRLGTTGLKAKDTAVGQAGTSIVSATHNNTVYTNRFRWQHVLVERYQSDTNENEGGTFEAFWDTVLSSVARFKIYRNVFESDATTVATPLANVLPTQSTLAYFMRPVGTMSMPYNRTIEYQERYCNVDLSVITRTEYA